MCRVAYTINNKQPVLCTYIGDQPLFYSNEPEPDEFSLEEEIEALDIEIEALKKKLELTDQYLETKPIRGLPSLFGKQAPWSLPKLAEYLSYCRTGRELLKLCHPLGVRMEQTQETRQGYYYHGNTTIYVPNALTLEEAALECIPLLKKAWLAQAYEYIEPIRFEPDNAILINRAMAADRVCMMILFAWEMKLSGYQECWDRLLQAGINGVCRAFIVQAQDFRTINNGQAMSHSFETWFLGENVNEVDRVLIRNMMEDVHGYVFDDKGHDYDVAGALRTIGEMPYGRNYLAPHIPLLLDDPVFVDCRSRHNCNFMWFIKFERSFRQAENTVKPNQKEKPSQVVALPEVKQPFKDYAQTGAVIEFKEKQKQKPFITPWYGGDDAA